LADSFEVMQQSSNDWISSMLGHSNIHNKNNSEMLIIMKQKRMAGKFSKIGGKNRFSSLVCLSGLHWGNEYKIK